MNDKKGFAGWNDGGRGYRRALAASMRRRITGCSPVMDCLRYLIASLLNFEEPCAVLLPLLGRRRRTSRSKSFEEFIHLSPRQIDEICAVRGGTGIRYHESHSLAANHFTGEWDKADAALCKRDVELRLPPRARRGRQCDGERVAAQHHKGNQPPDGACTVGGGTPPPLMKMTVQTVVSVRLPV